ncbi:hypothetical protein FRX31_011176 [Thalictrum thalictroides]|uniref:Uncharacterized protein n=1 Tax=Thalictrum thalictroides TaxID=46969 RepID=A0A7J6WT77_THATH|nr:hypothetical protein FRX31_011176 [Thalictrum thalictroides]
MSRHRRQASQALPPTFNVTEESIASMVLDNGGGLASQLGNTTTGSVESSAGIANANANAGTTTSAGSKKNLAMGSIGQPPLSTNNQVVGLGLSTNTKNSTVDGGSKQA